MEVVIVPDAKSGGELIAEAMAQLLRRKPAALLGVATGSTPLPVYEALAAKVRSGAVDASRARIAQLDEYVGLPAEHPESYRSVLAREVLEPLGIGMDAFMGPDGTAEDVQLACAAYDRALAEAGASPADVVRTRTYLTTASDVEAVAKAHGEVFAQVRPAATMVIVAALVDPRWRVEIEAEAVLPA